MFEVIMPKLGMTMDEGTVIRWLKEEGDQVEKGEPLLEVMTDKVTMEVEAPASGVLRVILAKEGETVPVVQVIGIIAAPDEELPEDVLPGVALEKERGTPERAVIRATPTARQVAREHGLDLAQVTGTGPQGRIRRQDVLRAVEERDRLKVAGRVKVKASPAARRVARQSGIDLQKVVGTGPGGRIVVEDVRQAVAALREEKALLPAAAEVLPLVGIRKVTAERMSYSFGTAPHFYLTRQVDAQGLVELRERLLPTVEEKAGVRLTYSDLLVKMVAVTLSQHPLLNAAWQEGEIILNRAINIGLATAVEDGLVVPVIPQADQKSIAEIAVLREELVTKANEGTLSLDEISGGTFTLTNLGMYEVDVFNAIINPPQSAILAVGRIAEAVVAHKGQAVVRPVMHLTLSADHRIVDGATAARFLRDLCQLIEEPLRLLI